MGAHLDILERIVRVSGKTVVLHGPAGAGKSAASLAMYRRFVSDIGRPRCLLILPNNASVSAARQSLLAASGGTLLSPQVMTFAGLAQRILSASALAAKMISPVARHLLLRSIVDELAASKRLRALGGVAETPGVITMLDRSISELKRAAAEPDGLAGAVLASGGRDGGKIADLLEIYRRYQQRLQARGLYDVEGRMWQARDELARMGDKELPRGMEDIAAMAVDGFTDFTPTQLRILVMLHRKFAHLLVTLPLGADNRQRLWQWTSQTLERIRSAFAGNIETIALPISGGGTAFPGCAVPVHRLESLCHSPNGIGSKYENLWSCVFDMDAPASPAPDGLRIIAAAGIEAEVAAVARRVKRLLVQGAAAGSIAVLARSMEPYRATIERVFAEHDIPVASATVPLTNSPLVCFLLSAAQIAPEFNFRDVLAAIKNSYFRPQALGEFDSQTVAAAEMLIREGNVLRGRQSYADAANRLLQRAQRRGQEQDDESADDRRASQASRLLTAESIPQVLAMLEKLFNLADAAQAGDLMNLAQQLALDQAAMYSQGRHNAAWQARTVARDLRSLAALEQAMAHLDDLSPVAWRPTLAQLHQALAAATVPAERGESMVDVMDVLDARAMRYEHVFLLGVGEGVFPQKFVESSLVGEADRHAWRRGGIELDRRGDLTAREMLLFYLAVSRANQSLTISYLASDAAGKPAAPSNFLQALLEPLGGLEAMDKTGLVEHVTAGQFLPPPDEIATARDAFNAAIAGLFNIDGHTPTSRERERAGAPTVVAKSKIFRVARGLLARRRRWQPGPCDSFDGRLDDADLLASLAKRFPDQTVFSASQFGSYGQCPWQFFAAYIMELAPLVEPERALAPVDAGEFCHNVLFRAMRELGGNAAHPLRLRDVEEPRLLDALDQAVREQSAVVESRRPPYPVLWRIQRDQMHRSLRKYLLWQRALPPLAGGATNFELSFGLPMGDEQLKDEQSTPEPVRLKTPNMQFQFKGRIDRVDWAEIDDLAGLFVIDYKTGRLPTAHDLVAGLNLQLPLYSAAAERILGKGALGGAFHHVGEQPKMLFFAAFKFSRDNYSLCDDYAQRQSGAMAKVEEFIDGMRSGRFDLLPAKKCPSWCPYRRICHFSPARLAVKSPPQKKQQPATEGTENTEANK